MCLGLSILRYTYFCVSGPVRVTSVWQHIHSWQSGLPTLGEYLETRSWETSPYTQFVISSGRFQSL